MTHVAIALQGIHWPISRSTGTRLNPSTFVQKIICFNDIVDQNRPVSVRIVYIHVVQCLSNTLYTLQGYNAKVNIMSKQSDPF